MTDWTRWPGLTNKTPKERRTAMRVNLAFWIKSIDAGVPLNDEKSRLMLRTDLDIMQAILDDTDAGALKRLWLAILDFQTLDASRGNPPGER